MKILAVSDEECAALWDYYTPGKLKDYDLIISCGDLKPSYLSFLVTMARAPLLYVHGNHDACYEWEPPEGCDCIEDQLVNVGGLRILGLGGCMRYNLKEHQYTERQMEKRIRRLRFALWRAGGVDIVVTHAPAAGLGDGEDPTHQGFEAFLKLMEKYKPKYLLHGHMHPSYGSFVRQHQYQDTTLINVWQRYELEVPDEMLQKTRSRTHARR